MGYMLIILIFKADYTAILKITARYHGIKLETVFMCVFTDICIYIYKYCDCQNTCHFKKLIKQKTHAFY